MKEYKEEILDSNLLKEFCNSFVKKLEQYKLSYYLRDKKNNISKENAIHSAIIWSRQAVSEINQSRTINGSKEINDLFILISYIDILLEATEQVYRVLYNTTKCPSFKEEKFCFNDIPKEYKGLNNKEYFKEIRALFNAHPVNIKARGKYKRFADIVSPTNKLFKLTGIKGDFSVRLWTNMRDDEDTIHFPLYVKDLVEYSRIIYRRYENYSKRLIDIVKKNI